MLQVNTRHLCLHGSKGIGTSNSLQIVGLHAGNRTSQVLFLHSAITDNHNFLEACSILFQSYFETFLSGYRDLLVLETDVRELEYAIVGNVLDGEVSVKIGYTAIGGAIDHNAYTNHGLTCSVHHSTCDCLLGISHEAEHRQKHSHKGSFDLMIHTR